MMTVSQRMSEALYKGRKRLSNDAIRKIRLYVISQQCDDGFFMNRNSQPDIYYTSFGLLLASALGFKINKLKLFTSFKTYKPDCSDLVHFMSYIRSKQILYAINRNIPLSVIDYGYLCWQTELPDFIKFPNNDRSSPYSQFILLSLYENLNKKYENRISVSQTIESYRVYGGGYANIRNAPEASVNATAAALTVKGQIDGYRRNNNDIDFLWNMQDNSGGFTANEKIVIPDMLSTATSLMTLYNYGMKPRISPLDFIEAHWLDSGGFAPLLTDSVSDIEYTFYGILALGAC